MNKDRNIFKQHGIITVKFEFTNFLEQQSISYLKNKTFQTHPLTTYRKVNICSIHNDQMYELREIIFNEKLREKEFKFDFTQEVHDLLYFENKFSDRFKQFAFDLFKGFDKKTISTIRNLSSFEVAVDIKFKIFAIEDILRGEDVSEEMKTKFSFSDTFFLVFHNIKCRVVEGEVNYRDKNVWDINISEKQHRLMEISRNAIKLNRE